VSSIKYKTSKTVAHAARAPQFLVLVFNYAHLLIRVEQGNKEPNFYGATKPHYKNFGA
jgi:hypothetical protein